MIMKATDLMIGDIVRLDDKTMKVAEIYGSTRIPLSYSCRLIGEYGSYTTGVVFPVPLTREILIKNGWNETKPHWFYNEINGIYLAESTADDGWIWETICTSTDGQVCIKPISTIKYVHELQHILRICKFTTEADNFKIK